MRYTFLLISAILLSAIELCTAQETLLLRSPSASKKNIVFAYGGDIWVADRNGKHPRRLTQKQAENADPLLSPNGKWVAFSGTYNGNTDVYVIPVTGGKPQRLTYHPGDDRVQSWDGNDGIIFSSGRESVPARYSKLFRVNRLTGFETALPLPVAAQGSISPDKKYIAYVRNGDIMEWSAFKLYRGGDVCQVWLFNKQTSEVEKVPSPGSMDLSPVWVGPTVYFISDRDNRRRNIYAFTPATKQVRQLTAYTDFDVRSLSAGSRELVYEQAGKIFTLDPQTGHTAHIPVRITEDMPDSHPGYETGQGAVGSIRLSPTGEKAVAECRGDIFMIPAGKGEPKAVTATPGVHELDPAWSPDGKQLAYFSDEDGEYALKICDTGKGSPAITINLAPGFYYHPVWSPDGKQIAFSNQDKHLFVTNIADRKTGALDQDTYAFLAEPQLHYTWSPDSRWLAYTKRLPNLLSAIFLWNVDRRSILQLSGNDAAADYAAFSPDSKTLFFAASTNMGPGISIADMSSFGHTATSSIYSLALPAGDGPVDTTAIRTTIFPLTIPAKTIKGLDASVPGRLLYLSQETGAPQANLDSFNFSSKKSGPVIRAVDAFEVSADAKKILYASGGVYKIIPADRKDSTKDLSLNMAAIKVYVDPVQQRKEMFNEVWRIERDYFYTANLHGVDIAAMKRKYGVFLPYVASAADMDYLLKEMLGETVVSHTFLYGGDDRKFPDSNVGLLGADYAVSKGHYRFKKIYTAGSWNPSLTAPLAGPDISVQEGEYLVAVNGVPLDTLTNIYRPFENTAGKRVNISINNRPSMEGARTVTVVPVGDESDLRMAGWVDSNREVVNRLSGGRIGYIYLPDTQENGYEYFNRYYFSQLDKEALIIDTRYNRGGLMSDYIVDLLGREPLFYFARRNASLVSVPGAVVSGPKVLLTNSSTASGGDLLAYMFRQKKLGNIVGTTTFGMVDSFTGAHTLLGGEGLIMPNLGAMSKQGAWIIENEGVHPDIEADNLPVEQLKGHDTQLEKTIVVLLAKMPKIEKIAVPAPPVKTPSMR